MDMLIAENDKLSRSNAAELEAERKRSEELAGKATSLEGLVASMETRDRLGARCRRRRPPRRGKPEADDRRAARRRPRHWQKAVCPTKTALRPHMRFPT